MEKRMKRLTAAIFKRLDDLDEEVKNTVRAKLGPRAPPRNPTKASEGGGWAPQRRRTGARCADVPKPQGV
jgi:hypothetical protein